MAAPAQGEQGKIPDRIFANASPRSLGSISLFDARAMIDHRTVAHFQSDPELVQRAAYRLQDAGFEILDSARL
jgi:hypothetical protein